jgi:hypothetical protein
MSDDFLNALLSTGPKEEDIRRKIHDELRDMSAGLTLASMVALGMKIDTDGHRIFDELLDLSNTESAPIKETDAMGREKFWEDLGRPDGK